MPLRSRLFAGDLMLEACAVRDSAHLTPGAQGTHVGKVQYSLDVIDKLKITRQELIGQVYGPSTAQAVLSFKSRRAIINSAYQSRADNIVGRMTIAALDAEMLKRQNLTPARGDCMRGGGSGLITSGSAHGFVTAAAGVPSKGAPPQLNKKLRVVFGITKDTSGPFDLGAQIQAANKALGVYGMSLDMPFGSAPDSLPTAQSYVVEDDIIEIRKSSETVRPDLPNVLRVIICKMAADFGQTYRGKIIGSVTVNPFVFLNVNLRDVSHATLLHEMIHASHSHKQDHDTLPLTSVFLGTGSVDVNTVRRTDLPEVHARELAKAYFA